jgi:hypothetical protein
MTGALMIATTTLARTKEQEKIARANAGYEDQRRNMQQKQNIEKPELRDRGKGQVEYGGPEMRHRPVDQRACGVNRRILNDGPEEIRVSYRDDEIDQKTLAAPSEAAAHQQAGQQKE